MIGAAEPKNVNRFQAFSKIQGRLNPSWHTSISDPIQTHTVKIMANQYESRIYSVVKKTFNLFSYATTIRSRKDNCFINQTFIISIVFLIMIHD